MTAVLWALQILMASVFAITGTAKIVVPRERLTQKMHWASSWPRWRIKLLGAAELAGAAGLVLPVALGIAPLLTPTAAVCLALLMLGAIRTHRRLGESSVPAAVVATLCVAIAAGRFYQLSWLEDFAASLTRLSGRVVTPPGSASRRGPPVAYCRTEGSRGSSCFSTAAIRRESVSSA